MKINMEKTPGSFIQEIIGNQEKEDPRENTVG